MVIRTLTIPLQFNGVSTASYYIFVPFDVSIITAKEVSVVNVAAPTSLIGSLKLSCINNTESLCHFPLTTGTNFCTGLSSRFIPLTKEINGNYTFSLTYDNSIPIAGLNTLNCWVNVTLEFSS